MSNQLRNEVEKIRNYYINKLLESGVYKTHEKQLYELTLSDLKEIYTKIK